MGKRSAGWLAIVCFMMPLLSACTGGGFHLRGNVPLPAIFQTMTLRGIAVDSDFALTLRKAFADSGHRLQLNTNNDHARLTILDYDEDKRVVGYGRNREVREFLLFITLDYEVRAANGTLLLAKQRLQVDKTQIYDSEFVLGKTEEERIIRKDLREDLARKILVRLRYGYPVAENTR